ncbi:uncharacterized protein LOC115579694 isoform X1 [Xyrichtys novacula]|uniref:Uncharacterized protein LOC115579694 isoform X1 n=1 Tax=Xyrichtys novacula TaxID=13765 RepID=A0AAV1F9M3_XYRNO|nr:uncharacterized protein LOC115579694 isoform X1 [Xyrichtys novacula]CAJ1069183.1 uncharacterized protein LOC115579694 isoform X1 [Xyrichtys novacula]
MSLHKIFSKDTPTHQSFPPLKVKVVALHKKTSVPTWLFDKGEAHPLVKHVNCTAAITDGVTVVKFTAYEDIAAKIKEGGSYIIKNYGMSKYGATRSMLSRRDTAVYHTSPIDVPAHLVEEGKCMVCPPSTFKHLNEIEGETDTLITVEGCITELNKVTKVTGQRGPPVPLIEIKIKEKEAEVKVCLWRETILAELCLGKPCRVTHLKVRTSGQYGFSLHTTNFTDVEMVSKHVHIAVTGFSFSEKDETVEILDDNFVEWIVPRWMWDEKFPDAIEKMPASIVIVFEEGDVVEIL